MAKIYHFNAGEKLHRKHFLKSIKISLAVFMAFLLFFTLSYNLVETWRSQFPFVIQNAGRAIQGIEFTECGSAPRVNCVVDGDSFYLEGVSLRVADIDTPETYGAQCAYEKRLGDRATRRFMQLLNTGDFAVRPIPNRDADRYGRKLRTVHRGNQSLGQILVREGLARKWDGRRKPWC